MGYICKCKQLLLWDCSQFFLSKISKSISRHCLKFCDSSIRHLNISPPPKPAAGAPFCKALFFGFFWSNNPQFWLFSYKVGYLKLIKRNNRIDEIKVEKKSRSFQEHEKRNPKNCDSLQKVSPSHSSHNQR